MQKPIGEGGMAVVYLGKDILLDRPVAVKVLRRQFASDRDFLQRFGLEARAAASLSHPNVISIYDIGEEDSIHYMVMEYIHGYTLKELIKKKGRLDPIEAVDIAQKIAGALRAAHSRDLIHRDIKPHNILMTEDGTVKVTDFGIARASSVASVTETGMVIGSVHYFSPEQARGDKVDDCSDLYSLGVIMYEMLTGQLPFSGESPVSVALKHLNETPVPVSDINPDIPAEIARIVDRLMKKDKNDRYENASEVLVHLRQALAPEHLSSHTKTMIVPDQTIVHPSIVRSDQGGKEETPVDKQPPKRKRRLAFLWVFLFLFAVTAAGAYYLPSIIFPEEVDVPSLIGLDVAAAQSLLSERGLNYVEEGYIFHNEIERGKVIRQTPEPDHRVRMGRNISVVLSSGPEQAYVPRLVGRSKIEAELLITQERFTLGEVITEITDDELPNIVLSQSPEAGELMIAGQPINIVVSRQSDSSNMIRMPNVRGMSLTQAMQLLSEIGFSEGQLHGEYHATAAENEVIDQNPSVGEEVEIGYPYSLAYAVRERPPSSGTTAVDHSPEDRHWEDVLFIHVPEGPAQEVVVVVVDDWGPRQVYREVRKGGSRFSLTTRLRGDVARIQVWYDGIEQMNRQLRRPGANS